MPPETTPVGRQDGTEREVVAAIDEIDGRAHLVVADITRDASWLAAPESEAALLEAWR